MGGKRLFALCAVIPVLFACGGNETENGVAVEAKASDASSVVTKAAADASSLQLLGKYVFFDKVSNPPRQACVSCHEPDMGWTGKVPAVNKNGVAIPGANPHVAGGRKPPTSAYASFTPPMSEACNAGVGPICTGGVFWDGRAEGRGKLGQGPLLGGATVSVGQEIFAGLDASVGSSFSTFLGPMADQALGPFGNNVEQNVPPNANDPSGLDGATAVCEHVKSAKYGELFSKAYGGATIDCSPANVGTSFKRVALAISAWQHTSEVNSFSSQRDACPKDASGNLVFPCANLSAEANLGHDLFYGLNTTGKNRIVPGPFPGAPAGPLNASCAFCHNSGNSLFGPNPSTGTEPKQLYADFAYHNIGLPANSAIENFNASNPDGGLGERDVRFDGHVKTPTLRNVDKRRGNVSKAYMHNGYFKSLEDVVHFYNTAAEPAKVNPGSCPPGTSAADARARNCWPAPEVENATSRGLLFGRVGMTPQEEAALVAYLRTFSDTNSVKAPPPYNPGK